MIYPETKVEGIHIEGNVEKSPVIIGNENKITIKEFHDTPIIIKNTKKRFTKFCNDYDKKNKKILVVGEVMLDHKIVGSEAKYEDVQKHEIIIRGGEVYRVGREPKTLGGAADIALAFSEISNVTLIGVIGTDNEGKDLIKECDAHNIQHDFIESTKVKTTTKIYIHRLTQGPEKEVIRFDKEDIESMTSYCNSDTVQNKIIEKIKKYVNNIDCIVIKDHQKGMISKDFIEKIAEISNNKIPLYVDPKYAWEKFEGLMIQAILPNMKEAASALFDIKRKDDEILERDKNCKLEDMEYSHLVNKYNKCKNFIIKAANKGAVIVSEDIKDCPIEVKPLLVGSAFNTDVGCGDVFDAFVIVGMLNEYTLEESVLFANFIAGLKTKKSLGEPIHIEDIKKELKRYSFEEYIIDNLPLIHKIEMFEN
jgi:D-beta-D-heptose 7-phosphate kinase/D-beta-D-heptose 1-phosphate adenosyltransferase